MKALLLVLIFFAVGSCTSLSKEQCQNTDWKSRGQIDASEGQKSRFADYQKQCQKHQVSIDQKKYDTGYNLGLKSFCTAKNMEAFGRKGGVYQGQCPKSQEKKFKKQYELAYREYRIEQKEQELKEKEEYLKNRVEDGQWTQTTKVLFSRGRKCSFDSDCEVQDECSLHRCESSGNKCSFDSDCTTQGSCEFNKCQYTLNNKSCRFDSDCTLEASCTFSKCENTGLKCSFDSDCEVEGECSSNKCRY